MIAHATLQDRSGCWRPRRAPGDDNHFLCSESIAQVGWHQATIDEIRPLGMNRPRRLSALACTALWLCGWGSLYAQSAPPVDTPTSAAPVAPLAVYGPLASPRSADGVAIAPLNLPPGVPPALLTTAAIAAENYPAIRNAEAEMRAAGAVLRGARWLRYPSLSVEALAVTRGSRNAVQNGITANLVAEQPVLTFGRVGGTIGRAKALLMVRRAAVDETARNVALQVTDTFYSVAAAARRQAILEDGIRQHQDLLRTIRNRVQQEISPQADLNLAMSRTAQLEQELEQARAQSAAGLARLTQLVGTDTIELGNVPEYDAGTLHPSDQGAIERAMLCDPTQDRLRAEVLVAEADAKVAKAALFPQLLGQLSRNEITGTRVGAVLRAQTGNGLSQFSASEAAQTRVQAAEFNIFTAERDLREQLNLDFVNNRSSRERVASGAQVSLTSSLVTESYKRQFIAGRRTWLDVMNAVREATTSKLSVVDAEINAMQSNAHIWLRTCGWQPRPLDSGIAEPGK